MEGEGSSIVTRAQAFLRTFSDFYNVLKLILKFRQINTVIQFPFRVSNIENISVGPNVFVGKNAWLNIGKKCRLYIGQGTQIGQFCAITGGRGNIDITIKIGKCVLIGERVLISADDHGYEDITRPVTMQRIISKGSVRIEDECWIGTGVSILSKVTIGKHSVVGTNAVVVNDIPPYSVAVGNPARVVKRYDFDRRQWVRTEKISS